MNEFDNLDHGDFESSLRKVKSSFSEDNDFKMDV